MIGEPRLIKKYGKEVWQHPDMDKLRRTECLCMSCEQLDICPIANDLLHKCKQYNLALAITRCAEFKAIDK